VVVINANAEVGGGFKSTTTRDHIVVVPFNVATARNFEFFNISSIEFATMDARHA
jgi:hypothetical protein